MVNGKSSNGIINILRSEVTFWLTIIALVVAAVVSFTQLQSTVQAMTDKGIKLRGEVEAGAVLLQEVRDSQIRMERDIMYIKERLE